MYLNREYIVNALAGLPGDVVKAIYDKSAYSLPHKSGLDVQDGYLLGRAGEEEVVENGYRFAIDWEGGQKTGFFIDQRENRQLLSRYANGRKVLNMFGYTGGFSVYALGGGATLVHTVDASEKAVRMAERNVSMNSGETKHKAFAMDAFGFFDAGKENYDLIVLDPPAFAKHQNVLNNALQGYKKLNRRAIELIKPGGILFTFSCSQVVSRENFRKSVFAAAANTGRRVSILHQMSQPADHPVSIYHPEGEYLKGLVLRIEEA
jgi:23S rRNA (cytosine1962-C5)-methyltransferase